MNILARSLAVLLAAAACTRVEPFPAGEWKAALQSPGGPLFFGLSLVSDEAPRAALVNGDERIPVPRLAWDDGRLVLDITHYDSRIEARLTPAGELEGTWVKRRGPDEWARLAFHAVPGEAFGPRHDAPAAPLATRWALDFAGDEDPAVLLLDPRSGGLLTGTVLTTTGDYRYLAGEASLRELRLACFDGAHAFLLTGTLAPDGSLAGDFWSGDRFHDTWTARPDPQARLPDGFGRSTATGAVALDDLVFPDLDGVPRSLADPAFAGRARILHVFGSWCPNCHDSCELLVRLQREHPGLSIVGLAFELTGDRERDALQVRTYAARHGVTWPLLLAGTADKAAATASLGLLDRVAAYPTTIFLHGDGRIAAVHSGFAGPATGAEHTELVAEFEGLVRDLLAESP